MPEFDKLSIMITEVESMIGIRGFKDSRSGPALTSDVLHVEVTGPISLHLAVMDLPGLNIGYQ